MCNGTIMTDGQRNVALLRTSAGRFDLETGFLPDNANKFYATAKNLYDVVWSCELEAIADKFVQSCPTTANANLSEKHAINFKAFPYNSAIPSSPLSNAINEWREQSALTSATNMYRPEIKEFSNIINEATLAIGCSEQKCGGGIVASAACAFQQPALRDGQAMYEIGSPCASDADCTLHTPATCNLDDRLCVLDITTTPIPTTLAPTSSQSSTSEPILSTTATVHSPTTTTTGNAHICPGNGKMNDRIRMKAIDMHNYRRCVNRSL
ncbi:unnamed protein product [Heligmosomoides polygyrus]|uniref:SCP domain-containing protein n=1 Tax=Heligmosomoides polygyrus TaxID=6339 RepID=A0A3P7XXN2_HELPZ|nr:unnamed protein product [Heligmosomoides polygyrus]